MFFIFINFALMIFSIESMADDDAPKGKHSVEPFKIQRTSKPSIPQYKPNGKWATSENMKYLEFLKQNEKSMQNMKPKQMWKMFKKMAKFVQTRNFRQCKSHHQRLYNEFSSIQSIIQHLLQNSGHQHQNISSIIRICENQKPSQILGSLQKQRNLLYTQPIIPTPVKKESSIYVKIEAVEGPNLQKAAQTRTSYQYKKQLEQNQQQKDVVQSVRSPLQFLFTKPKIENFPFSQPQSLLPQNKDQEWLECHRIFLMWTQKLNKLISHH